MAVTSITVLDLSIKQVKLLMTLKFYRFDVISVGKLPDNWTEETLYQKHSSKLYNANIAHVFYLAGHIEPWGKGIEKIINFCKENNLPLPIYHINPSDIMVQFNAPERLVIDNFTNVTEKVTEKELEVLKLIMEDSGYTSSVLAEKIGVSRKTVSNRIRFLKRKNIIVRIGLDTKGYWKIIK